MSPDPLRPEPGPRDWSPPGWDLPSARETRPAGRSGLWFTDNEGAFTVLLLGLIALLAASVSVPGDNGSVTVLLSTIGVFAVIAGVVVLRRARLGHSTLSRGRRVVATIGTALGAIALASTIATGINITANTALPTLHDAVSALRATTISGPDLAPPLEADPGTIAAPITPLPMPDAGAVMTFPTPDSELLYLLEVLERVRLLAAQQEASGWDVRLIESTADLPHTTPDGTIGVGSVEYFEPTLRQLADGSLELTVVGRQHGTTLTIALTTSGP